MRRIVVGSLLLGLLAVRVHAQSDSVTFQDFQPVSFEVEGGVGFMAGDVTYQIGDWVRGPDFYEKTWFPISELKWPLRVAIVTVGGKLTFDRFEARGALAMNINKDSGKMEDSDWEVPPYRRSRRTTYSETDADLTYWQGDVSLRYWVFSFGKPDHRAHVGAGAGYLRQSFDWDAGNGYQWTDMQGGYEGPLNGTVIHYEAKVNMPYAEAAMRYNYKKLTAEGRMGIAYARVDDLDDHILRSIRAETEATGVGFLADASVRYDLTDIFFAKAEASLLGFSVDGTEKDYVYGGEGEGTTWEIYHEIKSTQFRGTLALGAQF